MGDVRGHHFRRQAHTRFAFGDLPGLLGALPPLGPSLFFESGCVKTGRVLLLISRLRRGLAFRADTRGFAADSPSPLGEHDD